MKHSLYRTNAKGIPFVGTCYTCGQSGLTMDDLDKDCPNVRGLTQDQVLVEAITEKPQ